MVGLHGLPTTGSIVSAAAGEVHLSAVNYPPKTPRVKAAGGFLVYLLRSMVSVGITKADQLTPIMDLFSHWRSWIPLLPLRLRVTAAVTRLRPFLGTEPLRHPVDVAVRCLGWRAALPAGLEETGPMCAGNRRMDRQTEYVGGGWSLLCVVSHPCFSGGKYPAMDTSYQSVKMKNLYFTGGNGCWTPDLCTVFLQKMADFSRNVSKTYWWWYYLTIFE